MMQKRGDSRVFRRESCALSTDPFDSSGEEDILPAMKCFARALVALAAVVTALPATASADTNVIVLGIRSVEGDDELGRNLTGALRGAVGRVPDWVVADAEVSLSQMTMVHGCEEPDAACMGQIAEELGQQRVIYGTVRRTSAGDEYDFALTLYIFNAETGQIEDSLTDNIPRIQTDIDDLRPRATRYVTQFSGMTRFGTIRVGAVPGASVSVDGQNVGTTDDAGVLVVEDVAEGERTVRVDAPGYETFQSSVTIIPDEQADFRAAMVQEESSNLGWLPAIALIGVGAAALSVGTFVYWLPNRKDKNTRADIHSECRNGDCSARISTASTQLSGTSRLSNGDLFEALVLTSTGDAPLCSQAQLMNVGAANNSRAEGICDDQDQNKTLSIVFNVVGLAALGTGIALLMAWLGSDDDDDTAGRFQLTPTAGRRSAGLLGHIEF